MPVFVTYLQRITGKKDGKKWVIIRGIKADGDTVEAFISQDEADKYGITDAVAPSPDSLADVKKTLPEIEVFFDDKKRVTNIKA